MTRRTSVQCGGRDARRRLRRARAPFARSARCAGEASMRVGRFAAGPVSCGPGVGETADDVPSLCRSCRPLLRGAAGCTFSTDGDEAARGFIQTRASARLSPSCDVLPHALTPGRHRRGDAAGARPRAGRPLAPVRPPVRTPRDNFRHLPASDHGESCPGSAVPGPSPMRRRCLTDARHCHPDSRRRPSRYAPARPGASRPRVRSATGRRRRRRPP